MPRKIQNYKNDENFEDVHYKNNNNNKLGQRAPTTTTTATTTNSKQITCLVTQTAHVKQA